MLLRILAPAVLGLSLLAQTPPAPDPPIRVFLFPGVSARGGGEDRTGHQSASDLIAFLTYQSGRRFNPDMSICGYLAALEDERATGSLVELGASANPDLEKELDPLEKSTEAPYFSGAGWLLQAYAEINGRSAYPRLRRMTRNPLIMSGIEVDSSIAVSLGLTSYVSSVKEPIKDYFDCYRPEEPREALDSVILAWERNDREWLEKNLGPRAKAVLSSMLKGRSWADLRVELWRGAPTDDVAIGYRLDVPGRWSQPWVAESLKEAWGEVDLKRLPANPAIRALFTDSEGRACGEHTVEFSEDGGPSKYLVDDPELGELLRLITSCAEGN
jgi:hypothetical protein